MYDVAIVGARCAGSALALSLAREGLKVIMVDRATFPSDTMSGHFIHPAGVSALRRLGLLDDLVRLGAPAHDRMTLDFGPLVLSGSPAPAPDGTAVAYAPRRLTFDAMLAEAAVAAGAEFREATNFVSVIEKDGRISGLCTAASSGRTSQIKARLIVGADGKRSRVATQVGAKTYHNVPAATCTWYGYWEGLPVDGAELFIRDGQFAVATSTNDGLTFVAIAWPRSEFQKVRADVAGAYLSAASAIPSLGDRLAGARQLGRFTGTGDTEGFFREAAGPGWALLGDAGYHKDPITAQGMTDALLHAEILARKIVDGLGGGQALSTALGEYSQLRDDLVRPLYDLTADLARLAPPPPDMTTLLAALVEDPKATREFLGIMAGTVDSRAFFAPGNIARILGDEFRQSAA